MSADAEKPRTVLVTDCGSTTTKALLFERKDDRWHQTYRGEAPTTVEEPVADVTVGALNAFSEIEEVSGREILSNTDGQSPFIRPSGRDRGIDLYLSTSSAGGGLQMMVTGVVKEMTTESAARAALGAGAIVIDAISADDGREEHEKVERIRHLKPDIVLLTGGVDGGSVSHVIETAEILAAAAPRPRFGDTLQLPVIYAGNRDAADEVQRILAKIAHVSIVDNVRPTLESENLGTAREAIHELFLAHVMSHSPGYGKLMSWSDMPIMPTPAAVGDMVERYARKSNQQVLCVDIGGATTDLFSVFRNEEGSLTFHRSVSANLGMSYSVANVLLECGSANVARWLPFHLPEAEIRNRLLNKMIRPTSIPQTVEDLWLEQAVCREALRLSLSHHRSLAVGLSGKRRERSMAEIFMQRATGDSLVDLRELDLVIGSGGVLSHAPSRLQTALMLLDGFALEGITEIAVDSIFMMPHLGVFASVDPLAAEEIFLADCLIPLGHTIAPIFPASEGRGDGIASVFIDGERVGEIVGGRVSHLVSGKKKEGVELRVVPRGKRVDVGSGAGQELTRNIGIGECGIILDGRNRPIEFKEAPAEQELYQREIFEALGLCRY